MKKYVRETLILSDGELYWCVEDLMDELRKKYKIVEHTSPHVIRVDTGKLKDGDDEAFVTYDIIQTPRLPEKRCGNCIRFTENVCDIRKVCKNMGKTKLTPTKEGCSFWMPKAGESSEESV